MDDTTIWVSSPEVGDDFIILVRAIKRSDGSRDTSRDIPVVAAGMSLEVSREPSASGPTMRPC